MNDRDDWYDLALAIAGFVVAAALLYAMVTS